MGRQGIKLDKAHAFSSRFLQLCAQEDKALAQWGAIFHTTRQTISNWQTGESVPDIIKLADIAQYFGVSTDYLLGLSDTKSPDASAKAAVEYTGLSEEAVERLHSGLKDYELEEIQLSKDIIMCNQRITSALIECKEFPEIIGRLARAENSSLHEQIYAINIVIKNKYSTKSLILQSLSRNYIFIRQTIFANIGLSPVSQIYLAVACIVKIFSLHNRVFDLLLLNTKTAPFM